MCQGRKWYFACGCSSEDSDLCDGSCIETALDTTITQFHRDDFCNTCIMEESYPKEPHPPEYSDSSRAKARATTICLWDSFAANPEYYSEPPDTITDEDIGAFRESLTFRDIYWLDLIVGRYYKACFVGANPLPTDRDKRFLFVQLRDALVHSYCLLIGRLQKMKFRKERIKMLEEQLQMHRAERIEQHLANVLVPKTLESLSPEDRVCGICMEEMNKQSPGETPVQLPCPGKHVLGSYCARKVMLMKPEATCPYDRYPIPLGHSSLQEESIHRSLATEDLANNADSAFIHDGPTPDWLRDIRAFLQAKVRGLDERARVELYCGNYLRLPISPLIE